MCRNMSKNSSRLVEGKAVARLEVKGWSHIHEFHGELLRFYEIFKPLRFADEIAFEVFIRS